MPRIAAGVNFGDRMANPGRRFTLGPEFHGDLEFWRWSVDDGFDAIVETLSASLYRLLERPAQRTLFSDASKTTVRGFVSKLVRTGVMIFPPMNSLGSADRVCLLHLRRLLIH